MNEEHRENKKFIETKTQRYLLCYLLVQHQAPCSGLASTEGQDTFSLRQKNPLSLCVSHSLAPYFCPVNASFAFEAGVSPLLDTPR